MSANTAFNAPVLEGLARAAERFNALLNHYGHRPRFKCSARGLAQ